MIGAMLIITVITLWLLYRGLDVLLTLFGGIVMAVLLTAMAAPVTRWTRMPHWAAVLVVTLGIIGLLTLAGFLLAPSVSHQFDQLTEQLPAAIDRIRGQLQQFKWSNWVLERGADGTNGQKMLSQASKVFSITMTAGAAIAVVAFLAIYLALQPQLYVNGVVRLCPVPYRARAREVLAEIYRYLRIYLLTKLISMVFVGVCVWLGLYFLHIPLALALAVLAGLLEFIPTVGPLISSVPAILLAFTISPMSALWVALLYFAVQWIQNHVTNPLLQQKTLALPPGLGLAMVTMLGALFGFGGLLLSGPMSIVLLVLVRMIYVEDVLERRPERYGPPRRFDRDRDRNRDADRHRPEPRREPPRPGPTERS